MDLVDFLYTMLNKLNYDQNDTLHVVSAFIDFFKSVAESEDL